MGGALFGRFSGVAGVPRTSTRTCCRMPWPSIQNPGRAPSPRSNPQAALASSLRTAQRGLSRLPVRGAPRKALGWVKRIGSFKVARG